MRGPSEKFFTDMKKTILITALFAGLLVISAGFNRQGVRTSLGKPAPDLEIDSIDSIINSNQSKGHYTLLTFWSATDASSRRAVNQYDAWLRNNRSTSLDIVSVNLDNSSGLFNEIVRRDNLSADTQFNVSGNEARRIKNRFELGNAYGTMLINPEGTIVAHNPPADSLSRLIS